MSSEQKAMNKVHDNYEDPLQCAIYDIDPITIEVLVNLGADIDVFFSDEQTPTGLLLQNAKQLYRLDMKNFREALALLISLNPDTSLNTSVVLDAINLDEHFSGDTCSESFEISRDYIMDSEEHSVFPKVNDQLNFFAPLLIESGFSYSKDVLRSALTKPLEQTEIDYFCYCLDNPRSLKLLCRDALRSHFKNRVIHKFVSACRSIIPQKIQDFILLKYI